MGPDKKSVVYLDCERRVDGLRGKDGLYPTTQVGPGTGERGRARTGIGLNGCNRRTTVSREENGGKGGARLPSGLLRDPFTPGQNWT